jgi:hypothetical protein
VQGCVLCDCAGRNAYGIYIIRYIITKGVLAESVLNYQSSQ